MKTTLKVGVATAGLLVLTAGPASAQTAEEFESLVYAIDTVWVAAAAALVLLMHLGFGMLEAGLTRAKNAANIVAKNMVTVAIGATAYWAIGAALAYGPTAGGFIGTEGFFNPAQIALLGDGTQALFQLVFAATAATIVSGAVAERIKFPAYILVAIAMTGVIYPIVSHWLWGAGWLEARGFTDFAGSTLVHMTGGVAGLAGVVVLGPRLGKYGKDGRPRAIPGHSMPLAIFGVLVLWFGWFGFNGGSTLAAVGEAEAIGLILLNTTVAGGAGALGALVVNWLISKKPDVAMIGNGALAGLVGITAGPDLATGAWPLMVGVTCGAIVVLAVMGFDRIRIDDPVGAISVHGVCGAVGTLFVGVYAPEVSLGAQALGVVSIGTFVFVAASIVFLAIKVTIGIRVSEQEEIDGLDVHEHGVPGYPDFALGSATYAGVPGPGTYGFAPEAKGSSALTARAAEE